MIDIENAKKTFENYVSGFDIKNKMILKKQEHTYRVANNSEIIAKKLKLDKECIKLAVLIGLLHDIGRFEQAKKYKSFNDFKTVDHGDLGEKLLLTNGLIRSYVESDKYDNIIRKSVKYHNKLQMPDNLSKDELLYLQIIKDADKLDILLLDTKKDIRIDKKNTIVNQYILDCIYNKKLVDLKKTGDRTRLDFQLIKLALLFDVNLYFTYEIINENKYVDKIIDITLKNLVIKDKDIVDFLNNIRILFNNYIHEKMEETNNG